MLAAKLVFGSGETLDCLVNDLSDDGAKLQFRMQPQQLPPVFKLRIGDEPRARECRLRWATPTHIGVEFGTQVALLNSAALRTRIAAVRAAQAV
ncbi:PilZ domain-containing protein [Alsobacter sp. KACC 23698]|uniref:PilZ domain-containing protein n=1 Tax=Alsobacter sp. KACC 23698 TaxID=3149229 RepID=UPI0038783DE9